MNKLSSEEKVQVISCLVERNSLRSTTRMPRVHRNMIQNLLVDLGEACLLGFSGQTAPQPAMQTNPVR
jgi:hypothetical protein